MKYEIDTGHYINLHNAKSELPDNQIVVFDVYKLRVDGGYIYYRDLVYYSGIDLKKITSTAIFITDNEEVKSDYVFEIKPIDDLILSKRTINILKAQEIHTIRQLANQREVDLLKIPNFGWRSLVEVKEALSKCGLSLMEDKSGLK